MTIADIIWMANVFKANIQFDVIYPNYKHSLASREGKIVLWQYNYNSLGFKPFQTLRFYESSCSGDHQLRFLRLIHECNFQTPRLWEMEGDTLWTLELQSLFRDTKTRSVIFLKNCLVYQLTRKRRGLPQLICAKVSVFIDDANSCSGSSSAVPEREAVWIFIFQVTLREDFRNNTATNRETWNLTGKSKIDL